MEFGDVHLKQTSAGDKEDNVAVEVTQAQTPVSAERTHCHAWREGPRLDKKARRRLIFASFLCLFFMAGEVAGGYFAHSLAVMSDAAHLLTDFAGFLVGLMALHLAARPSTKRLNFGWYRAEVLGALLSIIMLWAIAGVLVYSGFLRIKHGDYHINAKIMLITSAVGVVYNIILVVALHQHDHGHSHSQGNIQSAEPQSTTPLLPQQADSLSVHSGQYGSMTETAHDLTQTSKSQTPRKGSNINVKAAFIHVLGDLCQSVGVLVAALIIFFKPAWKIADPICTFLFSIFVLITTLSIMRDIVTILMEGAPRSLCFEDVRSTLLGVEGVTDLHDLRLWSLTMSRAALSVHLVIKKGWDPQRVVRSASFLIQHKFNISQTTMQVEEHVEEMDSCSQCSELRH